MKVRAKFRLASEMVSVIGMSAFCAVMFAIASTLLNYWKSVPASDFAMIFALQDEDIMSMISTIVAPTIIALATTLVLNWKHTTVRVLWLSSTCVFVLILVVTVVYFVPSNSSFAAGEVPVSEVADRLVSWGKMHWVRIWLAVISVAIGAYAVVKGRSLK